MRFFAYDGPLAELARKIGRLMYLNLCFMLCALPVFTFGAAVTALYASFLNETGCSSVSVNFFRAFGQNFKKATLLWLILLAVGAVLGVTGYLFLVYKIPGGGVLRILLILLAVLYASVCAYVFPLQAHYENSVSQTLKNGCVLGIGMLLPGAVMALVNFLPLVLLMIDVRFFIIALSLWVFLGFSLSARINSLLLQRVFRKLQPEEDGQ